MEVNGEGQQAPEQDAQETGMSLLSERPKAAEGVMDGDR